MNDLRQHDNDKMTYDMMTNDRGTNIIHNSPRRCGVRVCVPVVTVNTYIYYIIKQEILPFYYHYHVYHLYMYHYHLLSTVG